MPATTIQIKDDLWWSIAVWEARQKAPGLHLSQTSYDGNEFLRLGWTPCQGLKIHAMKTLHVDPWHKVQAFIALDIFLLFFYVNRFFDFMSLLILLIPLCRWSELWPQFSSSFCAIRFSGNGGWSFYPYSKWPFIENVNRRIRLPMLREREELNCSQWAQSEDLIRPWTTSHVFHLCGDDLPADWNQPSSFHVHRSLEIHAPVTPTDCWLHSGNSGREKKNAEFIICILMKGFHFIYYMYSSWLCTTHIQH